MRIFVDESGPFAFSKDNRPAICCVGALVVPDCNFDKLTFEYNQLSSKHRSANQELKARNITDSVATAIWNLLMRYNCLFYAKITNMASHNQIDVESAKKNKVSNLRTECDKLPTDQRTTIISHLDAIEAMSANLFVQYEATTRLVESVLRNATALYSKQSPIELGRISWHFDAKQISITQFEEAWSFLLAIELRELFQNHTFYALSDGDYSQFRGSFGMDYADPDHPERVDGCYIDVDKVIKERKFDNSENSAGLQMADNATTILRRLIKKVLNRPRLDLFGRLMPIIDGNPMQMLLFREQPSRPIRRGYVLRIDRIRRSALQEFARRVSGEGGIVAFLGD